MIGVNLVRLNLTPMQLIAIQKKIYEIRNCKIMLDFDLAELYETETKYVKRAVRQNLRRFPPDFMFELTQEEWENLRCKFSTSSHGGTRYMPFAFTEQGVAMLSSVLKSDKAIDVNVSIMRAFVMLRQFSLSCKDLADKLARLEKSTTSSSRMYLKRWTCFCMKKTGKAGTALALDKSPYLNAGWYLCSVSRRYSLSRCV